jgi:hypothetical protein
MTAVPFMLGVGEDGEEGQGKGEGAKAKKGHGETPDSPREFGGPL